MCTLPPTLRRSKSADVRDGGRARPVPLQRKRRRGNEPVVLTAPTVCIHTDRRHKKYIAAHAVQVWQNTVFDG